MAMAFLETALNANPFTKSLFCCDDETFVLWLGAITCGMALVLALPSGWRSTTCRARRCPPGCTSPLLGNGRGAPGSPFTFVGDAEGVPGSLSTLVGNAGW